MEGNILNRTDSLILRSFVCANGDQKPSLERFLKILNAPPAICSILCLVMVNTWICVSIKTPEAHF